MFCLVTVLGGAARLNMITALLNKNGITLVPEVFVVQVAALPAQWLVLQCTGRMENSDLQANKKRIDYVHNTRSKPPPCKHCAQIPVMLTLLRMENIKHPAGESHLLPPLPVKQSLAIKLLAYKS